MKVSLRLSPGGVRKVIFWIHLWFGLFVGLYFAIVSATGSFLVFEEDITAQYLMPERAYVAPPAPDAKLLPLSQIIERLRKEFPEASDAELAFIRPPSRPNAAYLLTLTQDKRAVPTTVNPYTGKSIRRYARQETWLSWIDDLHVNLLFKARGKVWNGYGGVLAGVLLLSGLWLWWPRTLRQLKIRSTIKRDAGAKRIIADLHNVLGIYPFLLLLAVTLTGSVIVFYAPVQKVVVKVVGAGRVPRVPRITVSEGAQRLPVEKLLAISESLTPGSEFVFVIYPTKKDQVFYAYRRSHTGILPDTKIYLNPYNGQLLQAQREIANPRNLQIMRSASGIHFGRWGGWPIKICYFVLGFIPLGLFVTGVLMYLRKRKDKAKSRARRSGRVVPSPSA